MLLSCSLCVAVPALLFAAYFMPRQCRVLWVFTDSYPLISTVLLQEQLLRAIATANMDRGHGPLLQVQPLLQELTLSAMRCIKNHRGHGPLLQVQQFLQERTVPAMAVKTGVSGTDEHISSAPQGSCDSSNTCLSTFK